MIPHLDFSEEFGCILCFNHNLIVASDRRLMHKCAWIEQSQRSLLYTISSTQRF